MQKADSLMLSSQSIKIHILKVRRDFIRKSDPQREMKRHRENDRGEQGREKKRENLPTSALFSK